MNASSRHPLRLIVCVKQVPDVAEIQLDPHTHTLVRDGVRAVLNPFDRFAVEEAVRLRARHGGSLTVLTLGPPQAEAALREVLALGADQAVLLTDRAFAGSDTWATSVTLAAAVRKLGGADLILFGRQAADGDTAQVGPGVAARLGLPQLTYVRRLGRLAGGRLTAVRVLDQGRETLALPLPAVIAVGGAIHRLRMPTLTGVLRAARAAITRWNAADLGLDPARVGLQGSPTRVVRIAPPPPRPPAQILTGTPTECIVALRHRLAAHRPAGPAPDAAAVGRPAPGGTATQLADGSRDVWVLTELQDRLIHPITFELLGEGRRLADTLGQRLCAPLLGWHARRHAAALIARGADGVLLADYPQLAHFDDVRHAAVLAELIRRQRPAIVLGGATPIGRSLAPRLAALLDAGLTADCTALSIDPATGNLLQTRPAFGSHVLATIVCAHARPQMATVRPHVMQPAAADPARRGQCVDHVPPAHLLAGPDLRRRFVHTPAEGASLDDATTIVSGGRGLGSARAFAQLAELARLLGGALGASRAAVEAGWAPEYRQIGQTGRTVRPRLYVACGISGQIQHLAGVDGAEIIVAINRDPEAPIFRAATYGIVGDVAMLLPEWIRQLSD